MYSTLLQTQTQVSDSIVPLLETTIQTSIGASKLDQKIRVVSYNILFDLKDAILEESQKMHTWPSRLPRILTSIKNMQPDILCLQEVYPAQLADLEKSLESEFTHFIGTDSLGEMNVIFFKKERFELDKEHYKADSQDLSSASMPLPLNVLDDEIIAQKPHYLPPELEPGRQLTLAHFTDRHTQKYFAVLNTHFSFARIASRKDQAIFVARELVPKLHSLSIPVIFAGDLNTFPNRRALHLPFYDGDMLLTILRESLQNTSETSKLGHVGPSTTGIFPFLDRPVAPFNSTDDNGVVLDHIFISREITSLVNAIEPGQVDGHFPSDHLPVIADILLSDTTFN